MPREIKVIFRLIREGHVTDLEGFRLLWALFVAMSQQPVSEGCEENLPQDSSREVEVRGFAR